MKRLIVALAAILSMAICPGALAHTAPGAPLSPPKDPGKGLKPYKDEKGKTRYTHGPDKAPQANVVGTPDPILNTYDGLSGTELFSCVDDSVSTNRRIKFVYAKPAGYTGNQTADLNGISTMGYKWSEYFEDQIGAIPNVGCDGNGGTGHFITIANITVPDCTPSSCDFARIANATRTQLGDDEFKKYLVWYASPVAGFCGQAELFNDNDPAKADNLNGGAYPGSMVAVVYKTPTGGVTCWDTGASAHETLHTLGAVQYNAPHTTGGGHCTDGVDVMCYNDGGPTGANYTTTSCPSSVFLDCPVAGYKDDYAHNFIPGHTNPTASSYINTHWSVTSSDWWYKPANVAPPQPTNWAKGTATQTTIPVTWTQVVDDNAVAAYEVFKDGVSLGTVPSTSASYTFTGLTCGTSYTLGIEAVDSDAAHSTRANIIGASTASCSGGGGTGTFNSTADNWTDAGSTGSNHGTDTFARVDGSPLRYAWFKFNTTGNTGVTTVKIHLCQVTTSSSAIEFRHIIASPDTTWAETTLKWSNQPVVSGIDLATTAHSGCFDYTLPNSVLEPTGTTTIVVTRPTSVSTTADYTSKEGVAANIAKLIVT